MRALALIVAVLLVIWSGGCSSAMKLPATSLLGKSSPGGVYGWRFDSVMEIVPPEQQDTAAYFGRATVSPDMRELAVDVQYITWPEPENIAVSRYERRRYSVPSGVLKATEPLHLDTPEEFYSNRRSAGAQESKIRGGEFTLDIGAECVLRNNATGQGIVLFTRNDYRAPDSSFYFSPSGKYLIGAFRTGPSFMGGGDTTEGHIRVWDTYTSDLVVWWRYPANRSRKDGPLSFLDHETVMTYGGEGLYGQPCIAFDIPSRQVLATFSAVGDTSPTGDPGVFIDASTKRVRLYRLVTPSQRN